jgi:hypothetical protein
MTEPSKIFKKLTLEINVGFTGAAGNSADAVGGTPFNAPHSYIIGCTV